MRPPCDTRSFDTGMTAGGGRGGGLWLMATMTCAVVEIRALLRTRDSGGGVVGGVKEGGGCMWVVPRLAGGSGGSCGKRVVGKERVAGREWALQPSKRGQVWRDVTCAEPGMRTACAHIVSTMMQQGVASVLARAGIYTLEITATGGDATRVWWPLILYTTTLKTSVRRGPGDP